MDNEIGEIIRILVSKEVGKMVSCHQDLIRKVVRESMVPEMQNAVRQRIVEEIRGFVLEHAVEKAPGSPGAHAGAAPIPPVSPRTAPSQHAPVPCNPSVGSIPGSDAGSAEGLYVYGVVQGDGGISLGPIGLEGHEVHTISSRDLALVVHRCPAEVYQSADEERVKGWVMAHQRVVDAAWEWFGNVVPMGFDTIFRGCGPEDVVESAMKWLEDEHDRLQKKLQDLDGMAEYGVQVFWDTETVARTMARESPEIQKLEQEIQSKPRGAAYLHRGKLENALKQEMERLAGNRFQEFHDLIRPHVKALRAEKTKPTQEENTQMLMNLSCLAPRRNNQELGTELEKIEALEGFSVRFTGPWPPYSFV